MNVRAAEGGTLTCFPVQGRQDAHVVRGQDAEPPAGEIGGHEPGQGLDDPPCGLGVHRPGQAQRGS